MTIKILRAVNNGKTYRASELPDHTDDKGATWTRVGPNEEYNVHLKMPGKIITVDLLTWNEITQDWVVDEVPEYAHPDLTLYV